MQNVRLKYTLLLLLLSACNKTALPTQGLMPLATNEHPSSSPTCSASLTYRGSETYTSSPKATAMETITPTETDPLTITIVYDNRSYDPNLSTAWGFAALIEYRGNTTLFDTGGDSPTLLANMRSLEIDTDQIERVVLSHVHNDHIGGLAGLLDLDIHPLVYLPTSFPTSTKQHIAQHTTVIEVTPGQALAAGVFTTGEMGSEIPEQALIIRSAKGLVVITGCAHPGVVQMARQAKTLFGEPVYLVMGGFHLGEKSVTEIENILSDFREIGIVKVAPSHCTGDRAIAMFEKEYAGDFIPSGAGRVIVIGTE